MTFPGTDVNTDHNLVEALIRDKLLRVHKGRNKKPWNTENTQTTRKEIAFSVKLVDKMDQQDDLVVESRLIQTGFLQQPGILGNLEKAWNI